MLSIKIFSLPILTQDTRMSQQSKAAQVFLYIFIEEDKEEEEEEEDDDDDDEDEDDRLNKIIDSRRVKKKPPQ